MATFIGGAKRVTDIRGFLRDSAGGSSIKYMAEKGKRHYIYIPFRTVNGTDEAGNTIQTQEPVAISGAIHEWQSPDGKFKSTVCMEGFVRKAEDGTLLNDGTCPFCDRVNDAWEIFNYRKEMEEAKCQLLGEDRKKHLEKASATFADERKAKAARPYMYMLIVKFRTDDRNNPVIGSDGLPEYELKVMKVSASRIEKIQQQIANSGADLPGSELIFEYPAVDDKRLQVSQSTTSPVFPNNKLTVRYPGLIDKINQDVDKFDFETITKSFSEWAGMTTEAAKVTMDNMFEKWDEYKRNVQVNPQAQYLEYVSNTPVTQPALGNMGAPVIPGVAMPAGAPVIPGAAIPAPVVHDAAQAAPVAQPAPVAQLAPAAPVIPGAPVIPTAPNIPDPNGAFNGGVMSI